MNFADTDKTAVYRASALPLFELLEPSFSRNSAATVSKASKPGVFQRALARFQYAVAVRRTIAELSKLDDRILRDIGVERDGIRSIAIEIASKSPHTIAA